LYILYWFKLNQSPFPIKAHSNRSSEGYVRDWFPCHERRCSRCLFYLISWRAFCWQLCANTGIISLELGPPQDLARTKGFDFGLVLCLENQEALEGFLTHPAHIRYVFCLVSIYNKYLQAMPYLTMILCFRLHNLREEICEDSLAYSLVF
jgi:hypothetical protein